MPQEMLRTDLRAQFKTFGSGVKIWGATNFSVNHHAFEVPAERLDDAQSSAAALHNGVGYLLGYWLARVAQLDQKTCRTVSFEVGMQNGGMGSGLARRWASFPRWDWPRPCSGLG